MNEQIVIIGGGPAGTLAANRLQTVLRAAGDRIMVIDRTDPRDQELELLVALAVYGPGTLRPPEDLRLREGIGLRVAEAATIDTGRKEICLADGTTVPYDVLVLATGRHPLPLQADQRRLPAGAGPATSYPDVFVVRGTAGPWPAVETPVQTQVERLVAGVRRYLEATAGSGGSLPAVGGT